MEKMIHVVCINVFNVMCISVFNVAYKFKISRPKYLFSMMSFFSYKMGSKWVQNGIYRKGFFLL